MNKWIFGNARKDFLYLIIPGFITALLVHLFHPEGLYSEALAFFALAFCDSGHVYTTFWRTYASAQERSRTTLYWTVPAFVFLVVALWAYFDLVGLWSIVIYLTVFHNYRQFHGILKWEQKINKDKNPWAPRFLVALTILPFLLFHFRDLDDEFIIKGALWHWPNLTILKVGLGVYGITLFAWVSQVLLHTLQGKSKAPVTLAVLTPAFLYPVSFLLGQNLAQYLYPLVVAHGFAYFALMSLSLQRTQIPWNRQFRWWLAIIAGTALVFGSLEATFEDWFLPLMNPEAGPNFLVSVALGVYLIPLLTHYVYDGWLWKSSHVDAAAIYRID